MFPAIVSGIAMFSRVSPVSSAPLPRKYESAKTLTFPFTSTSLNSAVFPSKLSAYTPRVTSTLSPYRFPIIEMLVPSRFPNTSATIVFGRPMPVSSAPLPTKYAAVALPVSVTSFVFRRPVDELHE